MAGDPEKPDGEPATIADSSAVSASAPTQPAGFAAAAVAIGGRLGSRYQVTRLLGQGGMGAVYLAVDEVLGKEVALKVVLRELAGGTGGIERLRDEVLLAQKVTHPNVCRTYDLAEVDDHFLIKMEFVAGETLAQRLKGSERLPLDEALRVARAIALGLAAAHAQGVVHRDLKPQNVLLEEGTGRVVLMDFGIARTTAGASGDHGPVGTPEYMAPEQARSQEVDGRADLYALGCVLYRLVVGEVPFSATTPMATMLRHLMDPAPDPRVVRPDLPPWLAQVIRRLLEKEPGRRYTDAGEVLEALEGPRRRDWRILGPSVAAGVIAALAIAVAAHRYLALRTIDCANFTLRHGVMECLGPVDDEVQPRRTATYRFLSRRGHVLRVERRRGAGHLTDDDDGLATWDYTYDESGRVKETVARDRRGEIKLRLVHSGDLRRTDRRDAQESPLPEAGTDVTVWQNDYDERGHLRRQRFTNLYGSPRPNRWGAFGFAYTVDDRGAVTELVVLGADGKPAPTVDGVARVLLEQDRLGNPIAERYLGSDGRPVLTRDGWAAVRRTFDRWGNRVDDAYLGLDGKPALVAAGYAAVKSVYDPRGEKIQISYFGTDGAPISILDGYATLRARYDERGERVEEAYFDVLGQPAATREGFAVVRAKDGPGALQEDYFDERGQPVLTRAGYARFREERDAGGRPVASRYFGTDGKPALTRDGFAERHTRYDERGRPLEESYLGVDGKPTLRRGGYAARRLTYDERGRVVEEVFLGPGGRPWPRREGYAATRMRYDEQGNRVQIDYLDEQRRPALHEGGYAAVLTRFDAQGNRVAESYLGVDGRRVVAKRGWSRIQVAYDGGGRIVEEALFDAQDRPTIGPGGYAVRRAQYDPRGHLEEESYFGPDGSPVAAAGGFARWRARFDDAGHRVEERFLDANGQPALNRQGTATVRSEWNAKGQRTRETYLGVDDRPRLTGDGFAARGTKYDPWGRAIEVTLMGLDGKPILGRDGFAIARTQYDPLDRPIRRSLWGPDERRIVGAAGYSVVLSRYDLWGHRVEERTLGADQKPILVRGAAGHRSFFNDDGVEVRRIDFDLQDAPIAGIGASPAGGRFAWAVDAAATPGPAGSAGTVDQRPPQVADPKLRQRLDRRAQVHRDSYAAEQLRPTRPELFKGARGVLVVEVGATGERAGIAPGDLLLEYDGRRLDRPDDLVAAVANCDHRTSLTLLRQGATVAIEVPPGSLEIALEPQ